MLTAIVIGFATTALFLVVLLASRGLTGTDHVDGREREPVMPAPEHLIVAPILLPLLAAALMLLWRATAARSAIISLISAGVLPLVAIALLQCVAKRRRRTDGRALPAGNWPVPFGIVLVLDRLSALMLRARPACWRCRRWCSPLARWDRRACISTASSSSS